MDDGVELDDGNAEPGSERACERRLAVATRARDHDDPPHPRLVAHAGFQNTGLRLVT